MRLDDVRESDNVQDRRSARPMAMAGGGIGLLLLIGVVLISGGNLGDVFRVVQQQQQQQPGGPAPADLNPEEAARAQEQISFVKKILALTEDVWREQFAAINKQYVNPQLEIFRGSVDTGGCGLGSQAMGPFYCPPSQKVFIDLAFYDQLDKELGAPGDFAQAYVVAHEVGHHIQKQLGYSDLAAQARETGSPEEANEMSVRLELQADYLAGVWAHHAQQEFKVLEAGDAEEGLRAARQIGDDMLQKQATGRVMPEKFTHGSSAQRVKWLRKGLETGEFSRAALDQFFSLPYDQL